MLPDGIKQTIHAYLRDEFEDNRHIYFNQYFSSKNLKSDTLEEVVEEIHGRNSHSFGDLEADGKFVRVNESPILFWQLPKERWLIVFSSKQPQSLRRRIQKLDNYIGWLQEYWIKSDVVDDLYTEFSPDDESVNVERKWDPYHIYQRESEIPQELEQYYNDHIEEFVEKGIEFNIRTPSWMVEDALSQGLQDQLLNKSEISKSRFTYRPESTSLLASDGGDEDEEVEAGVTVRRGGEVVHRSGHPDATFGLIERIENEQDIYSEFDSIVPDSEFESVDDGRMQPVSYEPGKHLRVRFDERQFDENASLTLSNLLTVGQNDVDIHGVILERDELEFVAKAYTAYDGGEFEVHFEEGKFGNATLLIKPISGTTSGLVYFYHKLGEKFDPRISYTIENQSEEGVA